MSVSLEPVDVPETVESETTPTPTQIEESESNQTISPTQIRQGREGKPKESESKTTMSTDQNTSFRSQGGENPVEAPGSVPTIQVKCERSVRCQGNACKRIIKTRRVAVPVLYTNYTLYRCNQHIQWRHARQLHYSR